jgi:hypothetical protein
MGIYRVNRKGDKRTVKIYPEGATRQPLVPHLCAYIQEELEARNWDLDILAYMMVCGLSNTRDALKWYSATPRETWEKDWQITRLGLDLYFEVGPTDARLRFAEKDACRLARAFGTSDQFFHNIELSWLQSCGALESPRAADAVDPSARSTGKLTTRVEKDDLR